MWRLVATVALLAGPLCTVAAKNTPELFTSMAAMKAMLKLLDPSQPNAMRNVIDKYVDKENERLEELRTAATEYIRNTNELLKGGKVADFVSHPINAFVLIRQLHRDWSRIEYIMLNNKADEFFQNVTARPAGVPSDADVDGAATAVMRLMDTYGLSAAQMAAGQLGPGVKPDLQMSSQDTFFIGRAAYKNQDYYHTIDWMLETMDRIEKERQQKKDADTIADEVDTLEHLGFALYHQGNVERAMEVTERLVKLDPNHPRAFGNLKWYRDDMATSGVKYDPKRLPPLVNVRPADVNMPDTYEALCRGQNFLSPKTTAKYYCYYKRDRPFLRLAPFQVEIVHLNPMAVVFKNVIHDKEIEIIQSLAIPKLARATIHNAATGQLEYANYRITQSAWLKDHEHPIVHRINQRLDLMTNLNMETAEELQVANYGIGGHYEPHFDMSTRGERDPYEGDIGNRIATVLFYLSVPKIGGATVFTSLKAAVFPEKNGALFWHNLYRNGEPDIRTRHAACPVLLGEKWVTNKWIHERGQEFRRPCNKVASEFYDETFVGDL